LKFYLLLFLCSFALYAQKGEQSHYANLVEAYYDNQTKKPLYIYDSINGSVVDTLGAIEFDNSWYKISIIDSEYGWFQIKNIEKSTNESENLGYNNQWVKQDNFLISARSSFETKSIYLYDEPSNTSNKIHKVDDLQIMNIVETRDLWALVSFQVGKKNISGWLKFENQCVYP